MLQAVIGGSLKGTKLTSLSGTSVRPTSARVREAVFNILHHRISGQSFIDLFAGNGAMGIEAISRGARAVTLVEKDSKAAKVIRTNLDHCQSRYAASAFAEQQPWPEVALANRDAFRLVDISGSSASLASDVDSHDRFDIVWLDPPYDLFEERSQALVDIALGLVASGGLILMESDQNGAKQLAPICQQISEAQPAISYKQRRYGKSHITTLEL